MPQQPDEPTYDDLATSLKDARTLVHDQQSLLIVQQERITELEAALSAKATALKGANQAKRLAELHAAAVILETDPGFDQTKKGRAKETRAADVQVSAETLRHLNMETKLDVHEHTADCACEASSGARATATVKALA